MLLLYLRDLVVDKIVCPWQTKMASSINLSDGAIIIKNNNKIILNLIHSYFITKLK